MKFDKFEKELLEKMNVDINKHSKRQILKACCEYKVKLLCDNKYPNIIPNVIEQFETVTSIELKLSK